MTALSDLTQSIDIGRAHAVGDKLGRWTIFDKRPDELITGANDKHLDFRVSFLRSSGECIVLSTAVMPYKFLRRSHGRPIARICGDLFGPAA